MGSTSSVVHIHIHLQGLESRHRLEKEDRRDYLLGQYHHTLLSFILLDSVRIKPAWNCQVIECFPVDFCFCKRFLFSAALFVGFMERKSGLSRLANTPSVFDRDNLHIPLAPMHFFGNCEDGYYEACLEEDSSVRHNRNQPIQWSADNTETQEV